MSESTISYHIKVERGLDEKIQEALRAEARRRGLRRLTLTDFAREALWRAVAECPGEGGAPR